MLSEAVVAHGFSPAQALDGTNSGEQKPVGREIDVLFQIRLGLAVQIVGQRPK